MKKIVVIILLLLSVTACQSEPSKDDTKETEQTITLTIRNPKVEIAPAFEKMIKAYEKQHPHVQIEVSTVGGALDNYSDLKAQLAANEGPDIFTNPGYEATDLWEPYLEDLSDQTWVQHAYPETLEPITRDNHIYGMPMNLEGYGIIYNKNLFHQAGIKAPPTTFSALQTVVEKLEKKEITPFATGYYEKWKLGDHLMNIAIAQQEKPDQFIQQLKDGTISIEKNEQMDQLIDLLDLTIEHNGADPLSTDYMTELQQFTSGEAAMILQGNWVQPMIDKLHPQMEIGIFPIVINEKATNNALHIHVPSYWVVNKQIPSKKKKEAKRLLNWMVHSEQGQYFMTKAFHFIPAFDHIDVSESNPMAQTITQVYQENPMIAPNWSNLPAGLRESFGTDTQQYIKHNWSHHQLLKAYQQSWEQAY
ncbi:ABC transporter substrate-binding protein [Gracilibacillus sp. S3-1-1]|uniref:ABC transporter substrate-binding protein n=1 Tax=Gracilibacillus pellucidus TaxID=3095368 RepID=A0ACC6M9W3_9BACI|nr:ABC transporter substrate-binding protein [Gracilibacillus sp. S3-1-1]MDX8047562.1 ABC transporter substrate-binding protein [Gracilibacillus sp. S3-1-1]